MLSTGDRQNLPPEIVNRAIGLTDLRKRLWDVNELYNAVEGAFTGHLRQNCYIIVQAPSLVSTIGACETWQTLFSVDNSGSFFRLLAQTGQLFLEGALTSHDRVACTIKSFRKEDLEDQRHICEFHLMEIEGAFTFDVLLHEMAEIYRKMNSQVLRDVQKSTSAALGIDGDYLRSQADVEIVAVTYSECIRLLDGELCWGEDLSAASEQKIIEKLTSGKAPIFVTRFPKNIKFFNMEIDESDPRCVMSVDLILPIAGEAAGGAQRIYDGDLLKRRLLNSKMFQHHLAGGGTYADFEPYVNIIEQKLSPLHSGCGFGTERVIQGILRHHDIRLCSTDYMSKILYAWNAMNL